MWYLWLAVVASVARGVAGAVVRPPTWDKPDPTGLGRAGMRGLYGGGGGGGGRGGFAFYRALRRTGAGTRRVFGGAPAREWTPACVLLDRSLVALCSGAVLAPRWALTAAHCVRPNVAYVRYRGRSSDDDLAAVHRLYVHPEYKVKHADEGAGMDVVLLHHDVGLVRTRRDMTLAASAAAPLAPRVLGAVRATLPPRGEHDPIKAMAEFSVDSILGQEVEMLGYGRTERAGGGAVLRAARLRVAPCQRGDEAWRHCACAVGNASGVCSGDSGGPVIYQGKQVGVTSMGPVRCAAAAGSEPAALALSVFTALKPYAALINATMRGPKSAKRMRGVPARAPRVPAPAARRLLLAAAPALLYATS